MFAICLPSFAQQRGSISARLVDKETGETVSFATVSIIPKGAEKASNYTLSSDKGEVRIDRIRGGEYTLKVELMGFKTIERDIKVDGSIDLKDIALEYDREILDAASVTAVGNPIIIKKDTVEYNANAFMTTDNDVLEDLLKKLPGIEVDESGSIKWNGQTISKITIDGKTFFLDDPQIASKNIPAKAIEKLKVIEKKSEQAEFTGIDDGNEEYIIDLSVQQSMMRGVFGNLMAGAGHDVPVNQGISGDYRYQGAGFLGRFTDKTQLSVILNANNTNNRGFEDMAGNMMRQLGGGQMGGGRGGFGGNNGITSSYMGGLNLGGNFFENRMQAGGNYMYNSTNVDVEESSLRTNFKTDGSTLVYDSDGASNNKSYGHRFGMRLEHKFSDNTSIIFMPSVNLGGGSYWNEQSTVTGNNSLDNVANDSKTSATGVNKNVSANGFLMFRQRLGKPGRTVTASLRGSYSVNEMNSLNLNETNAYNGDGSINPAKSTRLDQDSYTDRNGYNFSGGVNYTEPVADRIYLEANYQYSWNKSTSDKHVYDNLNNHIEDKTFSNNIINENTQQQFGFNALYQAEKLHAQIGFSARPTITRNTTTRYVAAQDAVIPVSYEDRRWNLSPNASLFGNFSESSNGRIFYQGNSGQPSTNQLMPVPNNTNPLNISFGNPGLKPYFSHELRANYRYNNRSTFSSFTINANASMTQNPIVNALWYDTVGAQYSMPFNGPGRGSVSMDAFVNLPLAKSGFTISNSINGSWSTSTSYVGESNLDLSGYPDPLEEYYGFMEAFLKDHADLDASKDFAANNTQTVNFGERLSVTYRNDNLELSATGRTRMNKSWYSISSVADRTTTWNNQLRASVTWNWRSAGFGIKSDFNYNWYNGYTTQQPSAYVLNAELTQLLFNNKVTLSLRGYDILGHSRNLTVSDSANYHSETINNTLGRYVILSLTYRFGTMGRGGNRGGNRGGGPGGPPMNIRR